MMVKYEMWHHYFSGCMRISLCGHRAERGAVPNEDRWRSVVSNKLGWVLMTGLSGQLLTAALMTG